MTQKASLPSFHVSQVHSRFLLDTVSLKRRTQRHAGLKELKRSALILYYIILYYIILYIYIYIYNICMRAVTTPKMFVKRRAFLKLIIVQTSL